MIGLPILGRVVDTVVHLNTGMRHWIDILNEAWFHSFKYGEGRVIDVFKNPSRAELMKLIREDRYHNVRALVSPEDVYVFTSDVSHGDVQTALGWGLWDKARIFIDTNGPYLNVNDDMALAGTEDDYDDPDDRKHNQSQRRMVDEWCSNHPVLRHLFPNYQLGIR